MSNLAKRVTRPTPEELAAQVLPGANQYEIPLTEARERIAATITADREALREEVEELRAAVERLRMLLQRARVDVATVARTSTRDFEIHSASLLSAAIDAALLYLRADTKPVRFEVAR